MVDPRQDKSPRFAISPPEAGNALEVRLSRSEWHLALFLLGLLTWVIGFAGDYFNTWRGTLAFSGSAFAILLLLELFAYFPRVAVIGADGVVVRGLVYRRFVPFTDVKAIDYSDRGPILRLMADKGPLMLPILSRVFPTRAETARSDDAWKRLQTAWLTARFGKALPAWASSLARAGRTVPAWRRACMELLSARGPAYRTAAASLSAEDMLALLERPGVPVELRVGALFALADVAQEKPRIHAAAEDAAHPAVRKALRAALGGDLDERTLAEALAIEQRKKV